MKPVHMAAKVSPDGGVSALCFNPPHRIDLNRATWTLLPSAVTCGRCRKLLATDGARPGRGTLP